MKSYFFVKNKSRVRDIQDLMKTHMPTARFIYEPYRYRDGSYRIYASMTVEENKIMNVTLNPKWEEEDRIESEYQKKELSFWDKLMNLLGL